MHRSAPMTQQQGRSDAEQRRRLEKAMERVAAIKGFYIHLLVFVVVVLGLLAGNLITRDGWWVQWVFIGWGIGVLGHAYAVYGTGISFGQDWERRKIKEFMDKG